MAFCKPCWRKHSINKHSIGGRIFCQTCKITFYSRGAHRRHKKDPTSACLTITEFRCCDCGIGYSTEKILERHLRRKHSDWTAPPPPRVRGEHFCEECNKDFETGDRLLSHKANSRAHNPLLAEKVGCVGGCNRKFTAPSSLLCHLESGMCKSGITREKLDKVIIAHDTANTITDPAAVLARQTRNLCLTDDDFSSVDGAINTPDDSSDSAGMFTPSGGTSDGAATPNGHRSAGAGGVSLTSGYFSESDSSDGQQFYTPEDSSTSTSGTATPTGSIPGGALLTPSTSSAGSHATHENMSTTSSGPTMDTPSYEQLLAWLLPGGMFGCPLCPDDSKMAFEKFMDLQEHMSGPEHLDRSLSYAPSESGVSTISTLPINPLPNGKYECPVCPAGSRRRFKSLTSLRTHMMSPVAHMPKIYHCPDPEVLGIAVPDGSRRKKEKSFARLSALAQHVESGACQGGRSMFNAVVGFMNERLLDAGLGEMRMIAA